MDTEKDFQTIFNHLVEQYRLSPQVAAELLKRILAVLQNGEQ